MSMVNCVESGQPCFVHSQFFINKDQTRTCEECRIEISTQSFNSNYFAEEINVLILLEGLEIAAKMNQEKKELEAKN